MNKNKKVVLSTDNDLYRSCDRRVVISRDVDWNEWIRDWCDHSFVLWSNLKNYRGDKDAECPFVEDDDGNMKLKDGVVAFSISIYEHGGISYHLGDYHGVDAEWDSCNGAFWLWTDKEHWDKMHGEGAFASTSQDEFRKVAGIEVNELNMDAQGEWYCWREEVKRKWTKRYEDGTETSGCDWRMVDGCSGYLADDVNDIDFNRDDVLVFGEDGAFVGCELK